jgi:predicted mannosyl-3-phosphoglycerate phosphatase (HAD superfamily)
VLELEGILIITTNGEIIKISLDSKEIESMGNIEAGLIGATLSPDQERLVLATKNKTLL